MKAKQSFCTVFLRDSKGLMLALFAEANMQGDAGRGSSFSK